MAFLYQPPPSLREILDSVVRLLAHTEGVRVTVTIDGPDSVSTGTTVTDRRELWRTAKKP